MRNEFDQGETDLNVIEKIKEGQIKYWTPDRKLKKEKSQQMKLGIGRERRRDLRGRRMRTFVLFMKKR